MSVAIKERISDNTALENKVNIKQLLSVYYLEFMSFALIGWLYETIYTSLCWGRYAERGFLHIPFCPIYGFCCFFIIFVLKKVKNPVYIFLLSTVIIGVLEYLASYILEKVFNLSLWDYSYIKLNINGRVSIVIGLCFGLACVFLMKILHPCLNKWYSKIKPAVLYTVTLVMLTVTVADTIICIAGTNS